MTDDRPPPQSSDAECGILSCLLQNAKDLVGDARIELPPDSFSHPIHRLLYEEIITFMDKADKPLDLITFSQHLLDKGLMDKVGGPAFISELLSFVPTPAHYGWYVGILKSKRGARLLIQSCTNIIQRAYGAEDTGQLIESCATELSDLSKGLSGSTKQATFAQNVDAFARHWERVLTGKAPSAIPTRWGSFNAMLGGLRGSSYNVIKGERSSGKSTLAMNMLLDVVGKQDKRAGWFNYEMGAFDCIARAVSDLGNVAGCHLFSPDRFPPSDDDKKTIAVMVEWLKDSKVELICEPYLDVAGIRHRCAALAARGDLGIVVIDYCQLLPPPLRLEKNATRERAVAENSRNLILLSKELECPVIVLSQKNKLGDARESAAIENDADLVLNIEPPSEDGPGAVRVTKNRNGPTDFLIPLSLDGPHFRFVDQGSYIPHHAD